MPNICTQLRQLGRRVNSFSAQLFYICIYFYTTPIEYDVMGYVQLVMQKKLLESII